MCRLHLGIGSVRWQCRKAQRCENCYQGRQEPAHPPSQNRIRTSSHLRAHVCHTFPLSSLHCRLGTVRASMPQHHDFFRSILIVISPRYDNKRFISVSHYLLTYSFGWIITPTGGGISKLDFLVKCMFYNNVPVKIRAGIMPAPHTNVLNCLDYMKDRSVRR